MTKGKLSKSFLSGLTYLEEMMVSPEIIQLAIKATSQKDAPRKTTREGTSNVINEIRLIFLIQHCIPIPS